MASEPSFLDADGRVRDVGASNGEREWGGDEACEGELFGASVVGVGSDEVVVEEERDDESTTKRQLRSSSRAKRKAGADRQRSGKRVNSSMDEEGYDDDNENDDSQSVKLEATSTSPSPSPPTKRKRPTQSSQKKPTQPHATTSQERTTRHPRHFACPHPISPSTPNLPCPKRFTRRSNLDAHIRSAHTHHRPFTCSECPLAFARAHDLQRHRRSVHCLDKVSAGGEGEGVEGGKRYACEWCGVRFARSDARLRHLKVEERRRRGGGGGKEGDGEEEEVE
ncbi:hypothetical protein HDU67_007555 [Dinochytrium kinnereticum]|nr:hypothetical protein HDU67_007555 [Dinochytrium kinnereticum]